MPVELPLEDTPLEVDEVPGVDVTVDAVVVAVLVAVIVFGVPLTRLSAFVGRDAAPAPSVVLGGLVHCFMIGRSTTVESVCLFEAGVASLVVDSTRKVLFWHSPVAGLLVVLVEVCLHTNIPEIKALGCH